jgi:hypothetical protein
MGRDANLEERFLASLGVTALVWEGGLLFRNEAVWDWRHDENCCRLGGGRDYGVGVAVLADEAKRSAVLEPACELSQALFVEVEESDTGAAAL